MTSNLKNIYVSVYRSGSWDGQKATFLALERERAIQDRCKTKHCLESGQTTRDAEISSNLNDEDCIVTLDRAKRVMANTQMCQKTAQSFLWILSIRSEPLNLSPSIGILFLNDRCFPLPAVSRTFLVLVTGLTRRPGLWISQNRTARSLRATSQCAMAKVIDL